MAAPVTGPAGTGRTAGKPRGLAPSACRTIDPTAELAPAPRISSSAFCAA
ncbi:hypothetical protein [Amycolatopsis rifamycinica]|nr:hypothetical protein [Amycolatopsis rifamycinica]